MGAVKPGIKTVELFREDHDIPIVSLCDERDFLYLAKVCGFGESDSHAVSGIGAVSNEVFSSHPRYARVLNAEFLIRRKRTVTLRNEKRPGICNEMESVNTARRANDRSSGAQMGTEQHDVL